LLGALLAAILGLAGCQPQRRIELNYRPGAGTGIVRPFAPSHIAVMPAGDSSVNQLFVGTVFDANENMMRLFIDSPSDTVSHMVAEVLDHAGLKATVFAGGPPPDGFDYVVSCSPEELSVIKRIDNGNGAAQSSFIIEAKARLNCSLSDRSGTVLLKGEFSGTDNEPPLGAEARGEPLLSDPAEALSAAVADAIDGFANHPDFRRVLPQRRTASFDIPANQPRATSSATPTPSGRKPAAAATPHPAASRVHG